MTTLVALAVLASAAIHASWNAAVKGRTGDPVAVSTALSITWAVVGLPLAIWLGPPDRQTVPLLAGSVAVHLLYFSLLNAAYRAGGLSLVYTIARGLPPLFVAIAAYVVAGETLGTIGIGGIVLIVCGVLTLGLRRGAEQAPRPTRAIVLAVATALCISTYTVVDGLATRAVGSPIKYIVWLSLVQGTLFATGALALRGRPLWREVRSRVRVGFITGIVSAGGYAIALWAMTQAPIALVAALRETSVLFAAILGAVVLREPFGRLRIAAASLVAVGAVAIRLSG